MRTLEDAKKSLSRAKLTEEQLLGLQRMQGASLEILETMFATAKPSPELTLACRSLEEAVMWHAKAVANESK